LRRRPEEARTPRLPAGAADQPASRKKSGMCQSPMKPHRIRKKRLDASLRTWKKGAGLKTMPTWKRKSR
jgi:hypothetical protein